MALVSSGYLLTMPEFSHYRPCASDFDITENFSLFVFASTRIKMFSYSAALITIAAVDFDRLIAFYSILLQQDPQPHQPQVYAGFKVAGSNLGIFQPKASNQQEFTPQTAGAVSLCLSVDSLEQVLEHLATNGYPQNPTVLSASHGRECYIYDPDGNRIILHQGQQLTI
jgi:predicted enzyme related to lactoylglutathione lyase